MNSNSSNSQIVPIFKTINYKIRLDYKHKHKINFPTKTNNFILL